LIPLESRTRQCARFLGCHGQMVKEVRNHVRSLLLISK
jgi:hypothetical protein